MKTSIIGIAAITALLGACTKTPSASTSERDMIRAEPSAPTSATPAKADTKSATAAPALAAVPAAPTMAAPGTEDHAEGDLEEDLLDLPEEDYPEDDDMNDVPTEDWDQDGFEE